MNALVSIVTPLYNSEKYIAETIESVLAQTYPNWELIIVDDGSTDTSCGIVEKYQLKDNRIFLYERTGNLKGGSVCRNIGIEKSKGKYLIFLDSDDLLFPLCLENRLQVLETNPNLDFCVFQMNTFSEDKSAEEILLTHKSDNYLYDFLSFRFLPWAITCPIWKISFIREYLNGFDERFPRLQDPEFHIRALLIKDVKFEVYDDLVYLDCSYRMFHKKRNQKDALSAALLFIETFVDRIKERDDFSLCLSSLRMMFRKFLVFYTQGPEQEMEDNAKQMSELNRLVYSDKIIDYRTYLKVSFFLLYINKKGYKSSILNKILRMLGVRKFFFYNLPSN